MTRVLVTGAGGLVGRAVVARLAAGGVEVVASDLDSPANRGLAAGWGPGVETRWADLTDAGRVEQLVVTARPDAVVHLAAVIPPACYADPRLARRVNVEATEHLVAAAARQPRPPRFLLASSVAVYGARNPHTATGLLGADTPLAPADVYGAHKVAAEAAVRGSGLDWVVLRLGGVVTAERSTGLDLDTVWFEGALPADGRIQTVDVRDVAAAFAAAVTAPVLGETLLIGGDGSHRLRQGDIVAAITAALGLEGGVPRGLPGDPGDDTAWFATDWMDTARAQAALGFQQHSWDDLLAEVRATAGWSRYLLRLAAPLLHELLRRRGPNRDRAGYADPWGAIEQRWGHGPARPGPVS